MSLTRNNDTTSIFSYIPNFISRDEELQLFEYLDSEKDFVPTPQYTNNISRLQKWYQVEGKYFCPMWKERYPQWQSFEITPIISQMIERIQQFIQTIPNIKYPHINSCLINKYPNGEYFITPHQDSAISFGYQPTIINLSIGATRTLLFKSLEGSDEFSYDLEGGSIFIMAGTTNENYLHSINKVKTAGPRYSLTFREFIL